MAAGQGFLIWESIIVGYSHIGKEGMTETTKTWEDKIVERMIENLSELAEIGNGPQIKLMMGADEDLKREYGDDFVPFEEFARSEWGQHVTEIADWAEAKGYRISIDSELHAFGVPEEGRAIVNISPKMTGSPIRMLVFCELNGETEVKVDVRPFDEFTNVYDGPVEDLEEELVNLREYAYRNKRPFVSGRVHELTRNAGVNPSQARAIALREIGLTHEEVGTQLDISKGASGSYQSKFNREVDQSEYLFIARSGTPKRILAKEERDETEYDREAFYVCEEIRPDAESRAFFVTIREEEDSLGGGTDVTTETFPSLDACISEKYTDRQFDDPGLCDNLYRVFRRVDSVRLEEAGHLPLKEPRMLVEPNSG